MEKINKIPATITRCIGKAFRIPNQILYLVFLFIVITSCSAPKDIAYFQELENLQEISTSSKTVVRYKPQDIISIVISAADPETTIPFNPGASSISEENPSISTGSTSSTKPTYLIDTEGMIQFPIIGELNVSGLSSAEVKEMIKAKLKTYIDDPIVSVKLENFKVTVLGEVSNPGPFNIGNERVTVIEAVGLAGDLGIQGKRTNVIVLREENNKQVVHKVDLTSKDVFSSPVYYLAQNDVVYIEPNGSRSRASRNNEWRGVLTSVATVLGIVISVIAITR